MELAGLVTLKEKLGFPFHLFSDPAVSGRHLHEQTRRMESFAGELRRVGSFSSGYFEQVWTCAYIKLNKRGTLWQCSKVV